MGFLPVVTLAMYRLSLQHKTHLGKAFADLGIFLILPTKQFFQFLSIATSVYHKAFQPFWRCIGFGDVEKIKE
jgi:hypothetical protein